MDTRPQFLAEFLGALGAQEIRHTHVPPDSVSGTVVYDSSEVEEQQDFRWSVASEAAPSLAATRLVALIHRAGFLRSGKLQVSRQELLAHFNADQRSIYSPHQFSVILDEVLQVKVTMLDRGVESDYYFIHE
jgi:hypothetical protein